MSSIVKEIDSYYGCNSMNDDEYLEHYGMPRRSGRYPWGSGEDPYQHGKDFISRVEELKKTGWTETPENIKKEFGITTSQYRIEKSICKDERRMQEVARAKSLKEDGLSNNEIGRIMGKNESTIRSYFNEKSEGRMKQAKNTADSLKKIVDEKGMVDVGVGVERELNISREKLNTALYMLERDGYKVYKGGIPQVTNTGKQTNQIVLCKPETEYKEIYNFDKIHTINDYKSNDGGETIRQLEYPKSLDSKRLMIRYKEDGGIDKDGLVELRRGVEDISLGGDKYSQVRILVDDKKYIKGMAVYADDDKFPPGVDVIFNTNKDKTHSKLECLKDIKDDPDNPFGSLIKSQRHYIDENGKEQLSVINKRAAEGDWSEWSNALPSQFLSKQSIQMAQKQLGIARADKEEEFAEIKALTNPTIKKHLLEKFADNCDSAAVDLKAASLPGQKYHVIIPITSLSDKEIYAPNYKDGTKVACIRYPHGGTFEIPILTVNNKNRQAREMLGTDAGDGVGINARVAERLSGADFDGDTAMVIPTHDRNGKVKITSTNPLKDLEGFDPKMEYPERPGMKYMKDPITKVDNTPIEMGEISNLITDMTLAGADERELARAVKHSMVVIDAAKHKLDYKQSEIDNNIAQLKRDYQRTVDPVTGKVKTGGASTLISRAKSEASVLKRQGTYKVNKKGEDWYDPTKPEGAKIWKLADDLYYPEAKTNKAKGTRTMWTTTGEKITYPLDNKDAYEKYKPVKKIDPVTKEVSYTNPDGTITYRLKARTQKSTKMAEAINAEDLMSEARHPIEKVYAEYANSMKTLANQARLEMVSTGKIAYDSSAKKKYKDEVESLESKLNNALLNATRERAAQRKANAIVSEKQLSNPDMSKSDLKKERQRAISSSRIAVGSIKRKDRNIDITDKEWEAIQAGAISENKLVSILNNTDIDRLRALATPKAAVQVNEAKKNRIKAMSGSYTIEQIATKLGLSTSTVSKYLKG